MIEQLKATNLQKHENITLNFIEGVNVITGPTDSGKTAIFRGLKWVLMNDGDSSKLVKHGTQKCTVSVTIDGNVVERSYSASSNTYKLNDNLYKSFRTSVPGDIALLVNMDAISIQDRRDLPFMVYYKGSETAEQFSTMLDLNEIQTVTSNTNRYVKQTADNVEKLKVCISKAKEELAFYADVDMAAGLLKAYTADRDVCVKLQEELRAITEYKDKLFWIQRAMAGYERYADADKDLCVLEQLKQVADEQYNELYEIRLLRSQLKDVVVKLQNNNITEAESDIISLSRIQHDIVEYRQNLNELQAEQSTFKTLVQQGKQAKNMYKEYEDKLHALVGTVCPTCGQVIGEI